MTLVQAITENTKALDRTAEKLDELIVLLGGGDPTEIEAMRLALKEKTDQLQQSLNEVGGST